MVNVPEEAAEMDWLSLIEMAPDIQDKFLGPVIEREGQKDWGGAAPIGGSA
jgi:hypothetical protein